MKYVNRLYADPEYVARMDKLQQLENSRLYCCHGMDHLLAVARIAYILNMEEQHGIDKETVYLAAMLHDIGRIEEYQQNIPHHIASQREALYFLDKLQYPKGETEKILHAIAGHREEKEHDRLTDILYRADKASRDCRYCHAYDTCKWSKAQKEHPLIG